MEKKEYFKAIEAMGKTIKNANFKNVNVYGNYLAQTFFHVSHSTRLLAFAAGLMKREEENFFRRFIKHISEESAHEVLAQKDLEDLKLSPFNFSHLPETHNLWETQYYKILHVSPYTLMGYIIALEYFTCSYFPEVYNTLNTIYNGKAVRFIKLHAEEDPDHIEKAISLTEQLPAKIQSEIMVNIYQTSKNYISMIHACENIAQDDINLFSSELSL